MAREPDPHRPDSKVVIKDFLGFQPNVDPHDMPAGVAVLQINAMSLRPGELRVRPGFAVVQFDNPQ